MNKRTATDAEADAIFDSIVADTGVNLHDEEIVIQCMILLAGCDDYDKAREALRQHLLFDIVKEQDDD